jgi:centromere protein C
MDIGSSTSIYITKIHSLLTTLGIGTIPEPAEILKGPRNGKTLLPPRARSPIKTNLGSSPRRSLGPVSSPSRYSHQTPTRFMSHPPNETTLDMSREAVTPSVEASELEGRSSQLKRVKRPKLNGRGAKRPFNLSIDDDDDETAPSISPSPMAPPMLPSAFDDSQASIPPPRTKPGRGRPRKLSKAEDHVNGFTQPGIDQPEATREEAQIEMEQDVIDPEQEVDPEAGQEIGQAEGQAVEEDDNDAQESEPAQPTTNKRRGGKFAPSRKDQNAKMKPPPKPKVNSNQLKLKAAQKPYNKPSSRSLYVSRSETPADFGARTTRAGRNVLKPVAFWRGERIVYGDGVLEGSTLTLPGIKEVIRTEEVKVPMPKKPPYRRSKAKPRVDDLQEEEEEEGRESWETETGIVRAQVLQWDSLTGRYDEENTEEAGMFMQAILLPPSRLFRIDGRCRGCICR